MFTSSRLALCVCLLACFVQLYNALNTSGFNYAWVDKTGVHMSKTKPPKKRAFLRRGGQRHGSQPSQIPIIPILLQHEAQEFCSAFLHISPYAATTTATLTSTKSATLVTATVTSTSTVDLGTTTIPTTVSQSTTTTVTDATTTDTLTSSATITDTTTSTSTSYVYTAATPLARRDLLERDFPVPPWLPFPPSLISSACSQIVTPKTESVTDTTTATATLTATTTQPTTTTTQATATSTTTDTITNTLSVTETDTATTTASTTTTTTVGAIATQCAQSQPVDGGGLTGTSGTLNFYSDPDPNTCCTRCWTGTGCGLWFFFDGFGCFNAANSDGPNASAQCPSGDGTYEVITGTPGDGNTGGAGPCGGGFDY